MAYCRACGIQLVSGAKFCQKCGCPTRDEDIKNAQRQQEFAGKLYKCPNCGEILKSFELNCPSCGYELRGGKATSSVKEFSLKLEAIEAMREYEKSRGLFSRVDEQSRISRTDEQKISLIKSFPVPNSKEDLLEFMILATSCINMRTYDTMNENISKGEKELSFAWASKTRQVYEKAKRTYSTDDVFVEIKMLYDRCNEDIKKTKKKCVIKWVLMFIWIPLLLIFCVVSCSTTAPQNEEKEIERLQGIVEDVQQALAEREYKHALRIADSIEYQRYNTETERQWAIQREYWIDKVLTEAEENGIELEYNPMSDDDDESRERGEENVTGDFNDGVRDGLESGLDEVKDHVDEFVAIMDGETEN